MDKRIIDALAGFGLITVNVNAADYKDVDDLIAKGVVTVPGAKQKIYELVGSMDGAAVAEDIIIEIEETVETVVEETVETVVEETAETIVEETPKKKKSTKKSE